MKRILLEEGIDVLAVQETKMSNDVRIGDALEPFLGDFEVCVSHAVGTSAGCFLFLKKALPLSMLSVVPDEAGRFILSDFVLFSEEYRVVCAYAPNCISEREEFFRQLLPFLETDRNVILLGDFNCVCEASDRSSKSVYIDRSAHFLEDMVDDHYLVDVGKLKVSEGSLKYTRFQGPSHARLDRIYISVVLSKHIHKYRVKPVSFSDHCLVTLQIGESTQGSSFVWGLWKLNAKLLSDELFNDIVVGLLNELQDDSVPLFERWEFFKEKVKLSAIERSSTIAYETRAREKRLQNRLHVLCRLECDKPGAGTKDISNIKAELNQINEERYQGAVVRARAQKFLFGEQPTKRALAAERKYAACKEINSIQCGPILSSDKQLIENAFVHHYTTLFSKNRLCSSPEKMSMLISAMPTLPEEEQDRMNTPIQLNEIEEAIESLASHKSPGPDGIPSEVYKQFKNTISPFLLKLFTRTYEVNALPPSFGRTHTVLIPKSEDIEKLQKVTGYRPITLCNVDYKIFAKIISNRIQSVISEIVGEHQTCGIRGRTIQTNTHIARSVLDCCTSDFRRVAMLQIDLEKAFDRVSHDVIFSILSYVGFGNIISEGVKVAYRNCTTKLIINRQLSSSIPVQSSVRQGCPLSPLLFALYLEPLCLSVAQSESVRGFQLQATEVKVLAYADDVAVFCSDLDSVSEVVQLTNTFCESSGAAINLEKSCGLFYGSWDSTPDVFEGIGWSREPSSYLGVPLQHHVNSNGHWGSVATNIEKMSSKWGNRDISIFARASTCNVFLCAKLCYIMQIIHCSRVNIQRLHRLFALFIWRSGSEPMRRGNLFRSVASGGLGLTHLFVSQVVSRFLFLRDQQHPFLRSVLQTKLAGHVPNFIVSTHEDEPGRPFGFLKEVVESFRFLSVRFSIEYLSSVTRKKLLEDLRESLFPEPLYRSLYCKGPGKDVLCRVKKMCIPPFIKTFFFKLHSSTLPVKAWMHERGIFVPWNINCHLCKQPETIEHVFIECWDARFFWDVLKRTVKKELYITPYTIRFIPAHKQYTIPCDMLITVGLFSIWKSRMTIRHADPTPKAVHVFFKEYITQIKLVLDAQSTVPEWAGILGDILSPTVSWM